MGAAAESNQTGNSPDISELITAVFASWRQHGIVFVVLRNYENLPHATSHDIDVLVHPSELATAERLLIEAARTAGYHLSNRAEFSPVSLFLYHPKTLVQTQFDLFCNLTWRGLTLIPTDAVLNRRVPFGEFAIPHPIHEAINNLLIRLIYHGYVKEAYKEFIHATLQKYPQEMEAELSSLAGKGLAGVITKAIRGQKWPAVEAQKNALRRRLITQRLSCHFHETPCQLLKEGRRWLGRIIRPPGAMLVLLGADGCGKSSVATRLIEELHGTFYRDKGVRIHWKPSVFLRKRRAERPSTTAPHGQPPRGWLASQLALGYHWLEYAAGDLLQYLPVLFRNGMVLIERHHFDFQADPRRYRLQAPCRLAQFAFNRLRKPDLTFLLDAPAEVLHARKPEMSLEETRKQREAYRKLMGQMPNGRIIDCTQPLDEVIRTILRETLNHLEQRQSKRSGVMRRQAPHPPATGNKQAEPPHP